MLRVSVIIPAYNEERYIKRSLESLYKQTRIPEEIILVDDGSVDKTRAIVKKFKRVRLIRGKHKGPGVSRNLGARKAKGEILVFVDADMAFDKNYLKNLIAPLEAISGNAITGTTHDYEIATNTDNLWSRLWGKVRVSKEAAHEVKVFRAIWRSKFLEMGGFDPKYGYADDQTFYYKYGLKPAVAKKTICYHRNPESLKETYKQAIWIGRSWRRRFLMFNLPVINLFCLCLVFFFTPFKIALKSIETKMRMPAIPFSKILQFFTTKFRGYLVGLTTAILFGEVRK